MYEINPQCVTAVFLNANYGNNKYDVRFYSKWIPNSKVIK